MSDAKDRAWRYAIVQHPMWLIIAEDSICAERTPPWGCASIEDYAERLRLSLEAVEQFAGLHLSFDFSALELEDLARRYPDMLVRIRQLVQADRISFLNGSYSQPHFQIISIESAIRQFELGIESIKQLTGYQVRCYASQEPGFSPQLPQILRATGCTSAVTPDFPFGIRVEGAAVQHWNRRWEWLEGDDLVDWAAPDGTTIPLWLKSSGEPDELTRADDTQHGLLHRTRLRVDVPDMVQIDSDWVAEHQKTCRLVQLDRELERLSRERCHRPRAWVDANYAYAEGVDAEALSRANTAAESALLSHEALQAVLPVKTSAIDLEDAWVTLLACQHHDAYWTGAPELRAKSIARLHALTHSIEPDLERLAQSLSSETCCRDDGVMVLSAYPRACRSVARVKTDRRLSKLIDHSGEHLPIQRIGDGEYAFVVESGGSGYHSLRAMTGSQPPTTDWNPVTGRHSYRNAHYEAEVGADCRLISLAGQFAGNEWAYQAGGSDILPMNDCECRCAAGPVAEVIEGSSTGGSFDMRSRLVLYHNLPWFEVETQLDFREPTEIGDFFDDRSKLHFAWDVGRDCTISHAVGGCQADARPGKTFFAYPWLRVTRDGHGVAFCLFNATKCWLDEDGKLRFVAAWGHNGDHFHNRQGPLPGIMRPLNWAKPMDLRLRGQHTVRCAVWPHGPETSDAEVADWAMSLMMPPRAYLVQPGHGTLPAEMSALSLSTPGLLPLSIRQVDGQARLRMMETAGRTVVPDVTGDCGWRIESLWNLDGGSVDSIAPHKIVEAVLRQDRQAM